MRKTALITGASSGIGLELARVMAREQIDLVLVARNQEALEQLQESLQVEHSVSAHVIPADLSNMEEVRKVYSTCQKEGWKIDYLINNAGFGDFGFFVESDWEKTAGMIDLNIKSLTLLCKLFIPDMVTKKYGKVMNVASTAAFQPGPTMAVYFASKAYVLHFSEAIYNELKDTGVTVTALCPGATESNFQKAAAMEESKLVKNKKLPTSLEVAEYGYKAMMKGKMTAIHGFKNYLLANSVRFAPRSLTVALARKIQDKAK